MPIKSTNITAVEHRVDKQARWRANGHQGGILWFTGLSGAGKTTLALELEQALFLRGWQAYVLDGDNVRHGLSSECATASVPTSRLRPPTGPKTSAASARWRDCSPTPA